MPQATMPLVTAVVPVYNHEKYVVESIRSILDQTYPNIELIVINDGSKDHSHEMVSTLIEECKKRFVRFEYINRENRGLSVTLNQALKMAQGKYLSLLASDDVILPDKTSCLVTALESADENCAAAIADASFIDAHSQEIFLDDRGNIRPTRGADNYSTWLKFYTRDREFDYRAEFGIYRTLLVANYLPTMSALIRTACIREVGGWTQGNLDEDWETWLKLSKLHSFLFVDRITALYRIHGQNSIDTIKDQLLQANVFLVRREKEYCFRRKLVPEWRKAFNNHLWGMLRYGHFPVLAKLRELKDVRIFSFLAFIFKARYKTLVKDCRRYMPRKPAVR